MRSPSGNETPERRVIKDYKDDTIIQQRSWKLEAFYTFKKPGKIKRLCMPLEVITPIPTKKNTDTRIHIYMTTLCFFLTFEAMLMLITERHCHRKNGYNRV